MRRGEVWWYDDPDDPEEMHQARPDSAGISPDRKAGLERLAAYFEHPETAPWDWDVLRNVKSDAWRV
jgi:hypothetical protein